MLAYIHTCIHQNQQTNQQTRDQPVNKVLYNSRVPNNFILPRVIGIVPINIPVLQHTTEDKLMKPAVTNMVQY